MYKGSRVQSSGFECPSLLLRDSVPPTVHRYMQQQEHRSNQRTLYRGGERGNIWTVKTANLHNTFVYDCSPIRSYVLTFVVTCNCTLCSRSRCFGKSWIIYSSWDNIITTNKIWLKNEQTILQPNLSYITIDLWWWWFFYVTIGDGYLRAGWLSLGALSVQFHLDARSIKNGGKMNI